MSKKSFVHANPAMAFISTMGSEEDFLLVNQNAKEKSSNKNNQKEDKEIKPVPMKKNPEFIETKSKRVQMLIQPSLYNEIKKKAKQKRVSVNEMMHEILKTYVNT